MTFTQVPTSRLSPGLAGARAGFATPKPRKEDALKGHYIIIITPLDGSRPYTARNVYGKTLLFTDSATARIEADGIARRQYVATDVQYRANR